VSGQEGLPESQIASTQPQLGGRYPRLKILRYFHVWRLQHCSNRLKGIRLMRIGCKHEGNKPGQDEKFFMLYDCGRALLATIPVSGMECVLRRIFVVTCGSR
jgi:hypothetical protein